jgi:hypothetical protein
MHFRRQREKGQEGHEDRRCFFEYPLRGSPEGAKAQEGMGPTPARKAIGEQVVPTALGAQTVGASLSGKMFGRKT